MKAKGWFVLALVAGGGVVSVRTMGGCLNQASPDQKLAARLDDLCDIAKDGADKPVAGVRALGRYMGKHTGDLLGDLGATVALIERIPDDDAHDQRARMARDRIQKPLRGCENDWQRFSDSIEANPEARAMVDKAMIRLNRTLEILFGSNAWTLRGLPQQLVDALER